MQVITGEIQHGIVCKEGGDEASTQREDLRDIVDVGQPSVQRWRGDKVLNQIRHSVQIHHVADLTI